MTSSRVLPWIGGPSMFSWPGRMRNSRSREEHDDGDEHEDRHRGDDQDVPERVDVLGLGGALDREPVDQQPGDDAQRRTRSTPTQQGHSGRWSSAASPRSMRRASYGFAATDGNQARAAVRGSYAAAWAGMRRPAMRPWRRAEIGGRDAVMAAERLGELGRLAVSDRVGDLAHRQRCARAASRRRVPCGPRSGARGTRSCRSRCRRAGAGGARWPRGGRCRRAPDRGGTRPPRSRQRPGRGWSGGRLWLVYVAWWVTTRLPAPSGRAHGMGRGGKGELARRALIVSCPSAWEVR